MVTLKDLKNLIRTKYRDNRSMKKAFNRMVIQNGYKNNSISRTEVEGVLLRGGVRKSGRKRKKKEIFTYPEDWIDHGDEEPDDDFDEDADVEEDEEDDGDMDDGPVDKNEEAYLKKANKKDDDYVFEDDTDDDDYDEGRAEGSEDLVDCVDRCLGKGEAGLKTCLVNNCKVCGDLKVPTPIAPKDDVSDKSLLSDQEDLDQFTEALFDD